MMETKCLLCCDSLIDSTTNIRDYDKENWSKVLVHMMDQVYSSMNLIFPIMKHQKWNFKEEAFPFCNFCRRDIVKLCRLKNHLKRIEQEILGIVNKFCVLILSSEEARSRVEMISHPKEQDHDQQLEGKQDFFRRAVLEGLDVRVRLERCDDLSKYPEASPARSQQFIDQGIRVLEVDDPLDAGYDPSTPSISEPCSPSPPEAALNSSSLGSPPGSLDEELPGDEPLEASQTVSNSGDDDDACSRLLDDPNDPVLLRSLKHWEAVGIRKKRLAEVQTEPNCDSSSSLHIKAVPDPNNPVTRSHLGFEAVLTGLKASCTACDRQLKGKNATVLWEDMKQHIRSTHYEKNVTYVALIDEETKTYQLNGFQFQQVESGYKCSTCNNIYPVAPQGAWRHMEWTNIKRHIEKTHLKSEQGRCDICNKTVYSLSLHMRFKHVDESAKRICEVCGKEFRTGMHLRQHRKKVHGERKHECQTCGKKFKVPESLALHMKTHTQERPFICEHCGQAFRNYDHLNTHVASKHGERKFACDQCDWTFGVKFLLNRHVKQVHLGIKPPPPKKKRKLTDKQGKGQDKS